MGSKARIAKYILPIILKDRKPDQWYVEPFVGGANCIDKVDGLRIGNDCNEYIIALHKHLQNDKHIPYISKDEYNDIRSKPKNFEKWLVGYAGICCSYSGKWFGGYAGQVETKAGIRDYQSEALKNIRSQNTIGIVFNSGDYRDTPIPPNSIIYADPPYRNSTGYKEKFNHDSFYEWLTDKKTEGHNVFISEYYMPSYFKEVWSMPVTSSLSANGKSGSNKVSIEKLFTL